MAVTSSASILTDAYISILGASVGACQVANNYGILDSISTCGIVVQYLSDTTRRIAFQNQREVNPMTHSIRLYVVDTGGNSFIAQSQTGGFRDLVACALWTNPSACLSVDQFEIVETRFSRDPDTIYTAGKSYLQIDGEIDCKVWPDNS